MTVTRRQPHQLGETKNEITSTRPAHYKDMKRAHTGDREWL